MASKRAVANGSEVGTVSQVSPRLAVGASPAGLDASPPRAVADSFDGGESR